MQKSLLTALIVAIVSGLAIGTQSSLTTATTATGKITSATLTGLLVNFAGGVASGLFLLVIYIREGKMSFSALNAPTIGLIIVSGLLGIGIIAGIAYALPKIGVTAGLSTIIAGQMTVAGSRCGGHLWINGWRTYSIELVSDKWAYFISAGNMGYSTKKVIRPETNIKSQANPGVI